MSKVCRCGHTFTSGEDRYRLGGQILCKDCIEREAEKGNTCPCCKKEVPSGSYEVGLLLTPKGSSVLQKARAVEVVAIVCPHCKVIFFDDFTYQTLKTLK